MLAALPSFAQERSAAEKRAIVFVELIGGKITYDEKQPGRPVIAVNLGRRKATAPSITDIGLRELRAFDQLQSLILSRTLITDAGIKELKELKKLEKLSLSDTLITDAGMKDLGDLKQLRQLSVASTPITDAGLAELKRLTNLVLLTISKTRTTDAGIADFKRAVPRASVLR
jgi:hypothetical protein